VEGGSEWIAGLPTTIAACVDLWTLSLGEPFGDSYVSWVAPATLPTGERAVLKLQFPHEESDHEAEALRRWSGDGAIRLLDHHPDLHALLLEACEPGEHLSTRVPTAAIGVLIGLLPRLWVPAGDPFRSLADDAHGWVSRLPGLWENAGGPFERSLLEEAIGALTALSATQGEQVLVHQDLHGDNVLSAQREPWLVIDPKPLAGSDFRGPYSPIKTNVAGLDICELLPHHAKVADRFSILRSMVHSGFCHHR